MSNLGVYIYIYNQCIEGVSNAGVYNNLINIVYRSNHFPFKILCIHYIILKNVTF
jgi:hypothetical protein